MTVAFVCLFFKKKKINVPFPPKWFLFHGICLHIFIHVYAKNLIAQTQMLGGSRRQTLSDLYVCRSYPMMGSKQSNIKIKQKPMSLLSVSSVYIKTIKIQRIHSCKSATKRAPSTTNSPEKYLFKEQGIFLLVL